MKYLKVKDAKNRAKLKSQEIKNIVFKYAHIKYSVKYRFKSNKILGMYFLPRNVLKGSKTKINRRCIFSNRNKICSRTFNISRMLFNESVKQNEIFGYNKAIW